MNSNPDISIRYALPRYYRPASLQTTCYLFIFSNTCFETTKETVDSLLGLRKTIKAVKIFAETGVESDIIAEIQTYLQKRIDLDDEKIEVFDDLEFLNLATAMLYFEKVSAYREALQN